MIEKFREVRSEIMSIEAVTELDVFHIETDDLKMGLVDTCREHIALLLATAVANHRLENQKSV
jgi:hypothetical protein